MLCNATAAQFCFKNTAMIKSKLKDMGFKPSGSNERSSNYLFLYVKDKEYVALNKPTATELSYMQALTLLNIVKADDAEALKAFEEEYAAHN